MKQVCQISEDRILNAYCNHLNPWKIMDSGGVWTYYLRVTSPLLYQLSYQASMSGDPTAQLAEPAAVRTLSRVIQLWPKAEMTIPVTIQTSIFTALYANLIWNKCAKSAKIEFWMHTTITQIHKKLWTLMWGLSPRPMGYKPAALPTELRSLHQWRLNSPASRTSWGSHPKQSCPTLTWSRDDNSSHHKNLSFSIMDSGDRSMHSKFYLHWFGSLVSN